VRVRIRRKGGFTGNVTVGADLETQDLPRPEAARLESALERLPWGRPPGAPAHPDAFRYELSLPDSPECGTAVLWEEEVTDGQADDLAPLLDHLKRAGAPEPPDRESRERRDTK
jgi:hypothetical protein